MFLVLVSSSIHVSIFHIAWLDIFWTDHIYITRRAEIQAHTERCRHMWQGAAQPERNRAGTLQMMMQKLSGKQTRKTDSFIHHCPFTCQVSQASQAAPSRNREVCGCGVRLRVGSLMQFLKLALGNRPECFESPFIYLVIHSFFFFFFFFREA